MTDAQAERMAADLRIAAGDAALRMPRGPLTVHRGRIRLLPAAGPPARSP